MKEIRAFRRVAPEELLTYSDDKKLEYEIMRDAYSFKLKKEREEKEEQERQREKRKLREENPTWGDRLFYWFFWIPVMIILALLLISFVLCLAFGGGFMLLYSVFNIAGHGLSIESFLLAIGGVALVGAFFKIMGSFFSV